MEKKLVNYRELWFGIFLRRKLTERKIIVLEEIGIRVTIPSYLNAN